jgi:hypothetical protein
MPRPPSQAQIANQVTFLLKGDLKNARIAYIRAAVRLAQVRDQKLWQALKFRSLEEYAAKRLPLQKTTLYRYLKIHDWLRRSHPGWLVRRPKGFIPELSDADALMWLESRLEDPHLSDALRREVEAMRKKALIGYLTEREFRALQSSGRKREVTLRGLFTRLGSLRRLAARVPQCPAPLIAGLDSAIRAAEAALGAARHVAALKGVDLRMVRAA